MPSLMFLASALLATLATASKSGSVENCGNGNALFTVTKLDFYPDVLSPGENATLTLFYTSPEKITGGTTRTSITYNFIPFDPTVDDLCANAPCPITVGEHDGSSTMQVPTGVNGYIDTKVEWFDTTGRLLLCIDSSFTISSVQKQMTKRWNSLRNAVSSYFS
jgi:ML domain